MGTLIQISSRNQVTLPPKILKRVGLAPGDYVEVINRNGTVILRPKEVEDEEWTKEEIEKLDKLVKRDLRAGNYVEFDSDEGAIKYLKKLSKK